MRAAAEPAAFEAFCASPAAAALCGAGGPDGAAGTGGLWWTVRMAAGHTAELVRGGRGRPVCIADRERYAEVALRARLREFDPAVAAMKQVCRVSARSATVGSCVRLKVDLVDGGGLTSRSEAAGSHPTTDEGGAGL